jgi:hypothetical protein
MLSMKSLATGDGVRFFSVTMPTGPWRAGNLTGNALIESRFAPNRSNDRGSRVRNDPVASKAFCNWMVLQTTAREEGLSDKRERSPQ